MTVYEVSGLCYAYPQGPTVLRDIAFQAGEGEILTLLGPNGAGKSTLLSCLAGAFAPQSGSVLLEGKPLARLSARQIARKVGYVPQAQIPAFDYPVAQVVAMGRASRIGLFGHPGPEDQAASLRALAALSIGHLAQRSYGELSGGERQQVALARALAQEPKALLLDEPMAHLDLGKQECLLRILRGLAGQGLAIVLTTHNPDHALLLGGQAGLLQPDGRLCCGPCGQVVTGEALTAAYRSALHVLDIPLLSRRACLPPSLS